MKEPFVDFEKMMERNCEKNGPEDFLAALKQVPEYRGPEYWYRHLVALVEEKTHTGT